VVEWRHRLRHSITAIVAPDKAACGADSYWDCSGSRDAIPCRCSGQGGATPQMKNVPLDERSPLLSAAIQAGTSKACSTASPGEG
jgi:hypothetical protein